MQNWGKKGVFLVILTNFGKNMTGKLRKNACKNAYLGSFFIPEKYVIRVLFVSPWTSLISPLAIWVPPPPPGKVPVFKKESRMKVHTSSSEEILWCDVYWPPITLMTSSEESIIKGCFVLFHFKLNPTNRDGYQNLKLLFIDRNKCIW